MPNRPLVIAVVAVIACMGFASAAQAQSAGESAAFGNCPLPHSTTQTASTGTVEVQCVHGLQTKARPTKGLRTVGQIALLILALGGVPLKTAKSNEIKVRARASFKKNPNKPIRPYPKATFESSISLLRLKNRIIRRPGGSSDAHSVYQACRAGDQC